MAAAGDDPRAHAAARSSARSARASRRRSSTRPPSGSSARRARPRPSRATAASPARSAPRRTRWSCTASPGPTRCERGDIISVDIGVVLDGWVADAARTFAVGPVSPVAAQAARRRPQRVAVRRRRAVPAGNRLGDVSHAVQAARRGRRAVRRALARRPRHRPRHARGPADPQLRRRRARAPLLEEGMVLAVEPMVTAGRHDVRMGDDGWAIYSQDGSLAAHFEFTIAVTADGPAGPDARGTTTAGASARQFAIIRGQRSGRVPCARARASAIGSGGRPAARAARRTSSERDHEGTTVGQADVREVQDHPPPRRGAGDLLRTRVTSSGRGSAHGTHRRHQHPPEQARRDRPDLHLRRRSPDRRTSSSTRPTIEPDTYVRDLTEDEVAKLRDAHRRPHGRGRSAPRALAEHQAPDGDRLLPRHAPSPRPARPRAEHEDERPHAQGAQAHAGRRQEEGQARSKMPAPKRPAARPPQAEEEHPDRPGPHQDLLQQHDRLAVRPARATSSRGSPPAAPASRARASRRRSPRRSPPTPPPARASSRACRRSRSSSRARAPVARPRSARCRPPASRSRASRTSPRRPTTAAGPASGGGSEESMARDTGPQCKQCRREGQKLFLKGERCLTDKCGVERRAYPPGDHGRGRQKQSRVPRAAAREAEGPPLLRRAREAVPHLLREGLAPGRASRARTC